MELFIWLWAFDKRLLCGNCGESQTPYFNVYVWMVPCIIAASTLFFTYFARVTATNDPDVAVCFSTN